MTHDSSRQRHSSFEVLIENQSRMSAGVLGSPDSGTKLVRCCPKVKNSLILLVELSRIELPTS